MDITFRQESEKLQKTTVPSLQKVERRWYFLDLKGKIAGNWAPLIVQKLRGKDRPDFFPNLDTGGSVVIINAKGSFFTGKKMDQKKYYNHSGYPGKPRERTTREMLEKSPRELVFRIVKGMMPPGKLREKQLKRLFIYPTNTHPHQAQEKNFIPLTLK
ncbi:MAG: 50S ribosomal protein L13 [Candidatus Moeniiplasma glomeromycotorum]|nr:50S ribosomal protein L13 [Candidatus Moeniiplasma glomeromycotorum]MCE8163488.1 50S ribosomal protein L13 [Candidatus Moeniiplasma glomeromycotorum]MCE8166480.1 50S ribosomal protein L13 [Candidatus Moeniiplasma glomeromycotorum]MCE8166979.1 50S ribosomal protein L13 [Candidatus Moeniiplasma glomeromycotorum]MCE8168227.1 50S ribosomal protein L13 [Candidatus Moeniiplasma glomeromycotorum]